MLLIVLHLYKTSYICKFVTKTRTASFSPSLPSLRGTRPSVSCVRAHWSAGSCRDDHWLVETVGMNTGQWAAAGDGHRHWVLKGRCCLEICLEFKRQKLDSAESDVLGLGTHDYSPFHPDLKTLVPLLTPLPLSIKSQHPISCTPLFSPLLTLLVGFSRGI